MPGDFRSLQKMAILFHTEGGGCGLRRGAGAQGHPVPSGGEGSVGAAARSAPVRSSWSEQTHRLRGRSCPEGRGLNVESGVQRAQGLGEGVCHKPDDWGERPWPWGMGCFLNQLTPNLVGSVRLMTSCEVFRDAVGCHPTGLGSCLDGSPGPLRETTPEPFHPGFFLPPTLADLELLRRGGWLPSHGTSAHVPQAPVAGVSVL